MHHQPPTTEHWRPLIITSPPQPRDEVGAQMVGSILYEPPRPLSDHLQAYMDSCTQGVLYISMGTLGILTHSELQSLAGGLSRLPQCALWKLGAADLPGTVFHGNCLLWCFISSGQAQELPPQMALCVTRSLHTYASLASAACWHSPVALHEGKCRAECGFQSCLLSTSSTGAMNMLSSYMPACEDQIAAFSIHGARSGQHWRLLPNACQSRYRKVELWEQTQGRGRRQSHCGRFGPQRQY